MAQLQTIRRITVYATQDLEEALLAECRAMGAKGYTLVEARGAGEHAVFDDPFAKSTHVRIELLVQPAVADAIIDYLAKLHGQNRPVTACVESVQVADPEHF
jgi:hypothetical protein